MNESSDTPEKPGKPGDYAGLRAELATLADEFVPVAGDLWPRLEDHKYSWELYSFGLQGAARPKPSHCGLPASSSVGTSNPRSVFLSLRSRIERATMSETG